MTLNGLKTLIILRVLNTFKLFGPKNEMIDVITTKKSIAFHGFLMYENSPFSMKPKAMILIMTSSVKTEVRQMSII